LCDFLSFSQIALKRKPPAAVKLATGLRRIEMFHYVLVVTLMINGQINVQNVPGFTNFASCQLAGERLAMKYQGSSFQCVQQ
jgi:hypothetical protein